MNFFNHDNSLLEEHEGIKSFLQCLNILLTLGLMLLLVLTWKHHWVDQGTLFSVVSGDSMNPTLFDGQKMYSQKLEAFTLQDIVWLTVPEKGESFEGVSKGDYFVKRIIGTPGDSVSIKSDGTIYVNGDFLWEPYLDEAGREATYQGDYVGRISEIRLKDGEYFVLGDNRGNSLDSRAFGPVDESLIHASLSTSPTKLVVMNFSMLILMSLLIPLVFYHLFEFLARGIACSILNRKENAA